MKKLLLGLALACAATPAFAAADVMCTHPKTCKQVIGANYSAGGEGEQIHLVTLTCLGDGGSATLYQAIVPPTAGGLVAAVTRMNRISATIPRKVTFVPGEQDTMTCK